jgi:hypothetical protein
VVVDFAGVASRPAVTGGEIRVEQVFSCWHPGGA